MEGDFSNVTSPFPSFSYWCRLILTQIPLCVLWITQDLFHLKVLRWAKLQSPAWVTGLISHLEFVTLTYWKIKTFGTVTIRSMTNRKKKKKKLSAFNNKFWGKSLISKHPAVCNVLVRVYHEEVPDCLSNVMKGEQCHEFTTCVGKNVCTLLFILLVSVCDRFFSVTLCEGVQELGWRKFLLY